jgi:hypothetical protein
MHSWCARATGSRPISPSAAYFCMMVSLPAGGVLNMESLAGSTVASEATLSRTPVEVEVEEEVVVVEVEEEVGGGVGRESGHEGGKAGHSGQNGNNLSPLAPPSSTLLRRRAFGPLLAALSPRPTCSHCVTLNAAPTDANN